jgi:hypothetical protein
MRFLLVSFLPCGYLSIPIERRSTVYDSHLLVRRSMYYLMKQLIGWKRRMHLPGPVEPYEITPTNAALSRKLRFYALFPTL